MIRRLFLSALTLVAIGSLTLQAGSVPQRARMGMVITQNDVASQIGFKVIQSGGNAVDAAVATAMNSTPIKPTALGLSRCTPVPLSGVADAGGAVRG